MATVLQKIGRVIIPSCVLLLALIAMSTVKVSMVWSVRMLRHTDVSKDTGLALVSVLLLTPYIFALLHIIWNVPFLMKSKEHQLPPIKYLLMGVLSSVIEGACVTLFTIFVAPFLPVFILLPVLNGVFSFPMISQDIISWKSGSYSIQTGKNSSNPNEQTNSSSRSLRRFISGIFCVIFLVLLSFLVYFFHILTWIQALIMFGSITGLSVVWMPCVQTRILSSKNGMGYYPRRVHFLYTVFKILSVLTLVIIQLLFIHKDNSPDTGVIITDFILSFKDLLEFKFMIPVIMNIVSGLITSALAYLSLAVCLPLFGLILPSILSTLIAVSVCFTTLGRFAYNVNELDDFGSVYDILVCTIVAVTIWTITLIANAQEFVKRPNSLFTPFQIMFLSFGWSSVFFDQKLLLSYSPDGYGRADRTHAFYDNVKSRIYVCTTMYREADYEMERLLRSLQGLSLSEKLPHVQLEAHIFMDNGCKDKELQPFARQAVGLIITCLGLSLNVAVISETPYGSQIGWRMAGGMPLFLHLKDPQKVKAKKRWSQAMYLQYMINHRMKLPKATIPIDSVFMYNANNEMNRVIDNELLVLRLHSTDSKPSSDQEDLGFCSKDDLSLSSESCTNKTETESVKDTSESDQNETLSKSKKRHMKGNINHAFILDESSSTTGSDEEKSLPRTKKISSSPRHVTSSSKAEVVAKARSNKSRLREASLNEKMMSTLYSEISFANEIAENNVDIDSDSWSKCYELYEEIRMDDDEDVRPTIDDDNTYVLATDADMDFTADAVLELVNTCNSDKRLGAVCGRTHPIGKKSGPIVWHQKFEYAKDFWMIKNAQNVIGSVMCCPGCFSLYRVTALKEVMAKYTTPTTTPFTVYVKDTGEDRWMATLMMTQGWRLRYCAYAHNSTFCPDTFDEFFKQRRRWILSDMANAILVVRNLVTLMRNNDCFTLVNVIYLLNMFLNNIITPGTAIVMITAGMELVFDVPYLWSTVPLSVAVFLYSVYCTFGSARGQTILTFILTLIMGSMFTAVVIWGSYFIGTTIASDISNNTFQFQQHYVIILLALSLAYAAAMHPGESYQLVYGLAYLFIFPAMHILLPIYSVANIIDQSWGTRDSNKSTVPKIRCFPSLKALRRRRKKPTKKDDGDEYIDIGKEVSDRSIPMEKLRECTSEHTFWVRLKETILGNDVNKGLEKAELASKLRTMRCRCFVGMVVLNFGWLTLLSLLYTSVSSPLTRLNVYGVMSGVLYGFTLSIQMVGLTVCRADYILRKIVYRVYGGERPMWVSERIEAESSDTKLTSVGVQK